MAEQSNRDNSGSPLGDQIVRTIVGVILAGMAATGIYFLLRDPEFSELAEDETEGQWAEFRRPSHLTVPIEGPPWFRDVTKETGIEFSNRNGEDANQYTMLETLGGGVAMLDYDGDGWLDVFIVGGGYFDGPQKQAIKGYPCKLYRNCGGWKFKDVTRQVGLEGPWWYTHGAAVADYDRDGWPDLAVTGYGRLAILHNEPNAAGGRRFVDVTERLGIREQTWSTSAAWADIDGDGFPDLYVCHYLDWSFINHPECRREGASEVRDVCPPLVFNPLVHSLYRNDEGVRFHDIGPKLGFRALGNGLGVVAVDINDDQRPDIYVANDRTNNFLFVNRKNTLEEKALLAGVAIDEHGNATGSMGVDAADFDGSGRASLFVSNYETEVHSLFQNRGEEFFSYKSTTTGIAAIGQSFVGWGTGFIDVNNDGWEDLVIVNGHLYRSHSRGNRQRPILLQNVEKEGRRAFKEIGPQAGGFFQTPVNARGMAIGDLDNDGWPDLIVSLRNGPVTVLRNEAADASTPPARWLGVKLQGKGNRDVVGSTVVLEANGRRLTRFAKGGGSFLSANDQRILFGLGSADKVQRVTVKWSWGKTESWENVASNAYWELREGEATPKRMYAPAK